MQSANSTIMFSKEYEGIAEDGNIKNGKFRKGNRVDFRAKIIKAETFGHES